MVELILPPDPRSLLPPLLACLPAAFASPRPPPALLPLLSPVLRQRVQIFTSLSSSQTDPWIRLLCWNADRAERLQNVVESADFELHPVSGEIELQGDVAASYKRVDEETLYSRLLLPDYNLDVIYLWCPSDEDGGGPGWRVAELLPYNDSLSPEEYRTWAPSIGDANTWAREKLMEDAFRAAERREQQTTTTTQQEDEDNGDDDDAYWARYDATPGRTPSIVPPDQTQPQPHFPPFQQQPIDPETSYFARYVDVQPVMDNDDPSERQRLGLIEEPPLNGKILTQLLQNRSWSPAPAKKASTTNGYLDGVSVVANGHAATALNLNYPRPSSASSGSLDAVAKLEQEAESQSVCEAGVKQHIGASIKSLFRLAKCTGVSRAEFESLVSTELELLSLSDEE